MVFSPTQAKELLRLRPTGRGKFRSGGIQLLVGANCLIRVWASAVLGGLPRWIDKAVDVLRHGKSLHRDPGSLVKTVDHGVVGPASFVYVRPNASRRRFKIIAAPSMTLRPISSTCRLRQDSSGVPLTQWLKEPSAGPVWTW